MSDYEQIVISAVRYALGKMTWIVNLTVEYVIKSIDNKELSKKCLQLIKRDIVEELNPEKLRVDPIFAADCIEDWQRLLKKIDEVIDAEVLNKSSYRDIGILRLETAYQQGIAEAFKNNKSR